MVEHEMLSEVRRMRDEGASPKAIARALGVRRSVIAPLLRQVAAEVPMPLPSEAELVGCWVSPGWSSELQVVGRECWDDVDLGPDAPSGIALALVARAGRRNQISVCGYLVDTFCLGVKNVIGPDRLTRRGLGSFVATCFRAFPAPAISVPIELPQHLVLGAVTYAASLGFSAHPAFEGARGHLGELKEPCAITFGRHGRPLYVAGPHDDSAAVLETLMAAVGTDGFAVAAGALVRQTAMTNA
jgi:hypothetical protein